MFKGSFVALITLFRDGKVDETAFQEHVALGSPRTGHPWPRAGSANDRRNARRSRKTSRSA